MSVGGALGGLFCALIAPLIFNWTYEHLLLLIAAGYLMLCRSPFDRFVNLWDGGKQRASQRLRESSPSLCLRSSVSRSSACRVRRS